MKVRKKAKQKRFFLQITLIVLTWVGDDVLYRLKKATRRKFVMSRMVWRIEKVKEKGVDAAVLLRLLFVTR